MPALRYECMFHLDPKAAALAADLEGTRLPGIKEAPKDAWAEHAHGAELAAGNEKPGVTSAGLVTEETTGAGSAPAPSGAALLFEHRKKQDISGSPLHSATGMSWPCK